MENKENLKFEKTIEQNLTFEKFRDWLEQLAEGTELGGEDGSYGPCNCPISLYIANTTGYNVLTGATSTGLKEGFPHGPFVLVPKWAVSFISRVDMESLALGGNLLKKKPTREMCLNLLKVIEGEGDVESST